MTELFRPSDANDTTEAQWWPIAALWAPDGIVPGSGGGPGVGELEPFATGSDFVVRVRPGNAWIEGELYSNTGTVTLTPTAAHATNIRRDYLVVRMTWTAGLTAATGVLMLLAGATDGTQALHALTQTPGTTYDFVVAVVTIPAAATTLAANKVERVPVWTGSGAYVAPGTIIDWPTLTPPVGWLICDGAFYSQVAYNRLFGVISTNYGGTSTTFQVPDLRGRVVVGLDNMGSSAGVLPSASTPGASGGTSLLQLHEEHLPVHHHAVSISGTTGQETADHTHTVDYGTLTTDAASDTHDHGVAATGVSSGGSAHHHNVAVVGADVNADAGAFTVPGPGAGTTDEESGHTHTTDVTGTTNTITSTHGHLLSVPARTSSGIGSNDHQHLVASAPDQITGTTGGDNVLDNTQPWLALVTIIKY